MPKRTILIASWFEPEHVERIRDVDPGLEVLYEPDLLAQPIHPADHRADGFARTPEQDQRWRALLGRAEVMLDFDRINPGDLPANAPKLQWVQATSAGIGEFVRRSGYRETLPRVRFTTASGVHAQPLMEFCFMVMFALHKKLPHAMREQHARHWQRFAVSDLSGQALVVVGVGAVGKEVARMGQAMRMRVVGVKRSVTGIDPASLHLDVLYPHTELDRALREGENVVLIAPHTGETEGMIGARELALLPKGAVFINIARGALVDEDALAGALRSGHLLGAGLDVFRTEPLPAASPFWDMDNVYIYPHSASTSDRENGRITDIFCDNLRRFLDGRPLVNEFSWERGF